jgi:hypothetical protein
MSRYDRYSRSRPKPAVVPVAPVCGQVNEGDEYVCRACWLRWPIVEDRPPCPKGNGPISPDYFETVDNLTEPD